MTDGYLSTNVPHADAWRGLGYVIEQSTDGPVVDIRISGRPVVLHIRSASADDLMKLRAVISAAITALGYGEDLPPMDAVQRVVEKLNEEASAAGARASQLHADHPLAGALWNGTQGGYEAAARLVTRELVGAALAQAVNEEPEPAGVTDFLKCECHE